jgi:hypothetical protein
MLGEAEKPSISPMKVKRATKSVPTVDVEKVVPGLLLSNVPEVTVETVEAKLPLEEDVPTR